MNWNIIKIFFPNHYEDIEHVFPNPLLGIGGKYRQTMSLW